VVAAMAQIPPNAIDREPLADLEKTLSALREPWPPDIAAISAGGRDTSATDGNQRGSQAAASEAIRSAFGVVSDAGAAATTLFTTGRLMYHGAACTFADGRSQAYAATSRALHDLLPQVVAWELREAGLYCQCVCPMCGLGACGCIWASLHTISIAWGRPGLPGPDERGIPLRSPPRPGSQLADAGVPQWAHLTAVDGEPVRSPFDLQKALRQHSIGDEVRLRVEHEGDSREILVRHVSDIG
ncbi:MAG: PDZ domain-containing protein, partial [Chloroflexi bacterium]|nr:PDZ domain-containing protein [Chloroflexota bacterium]